MRTLILHYHFTHICCCIDAVERKFHRQKHFHLEIIKKKIIDKWPQKNKGNFLSARGSKLKGRQNKVAKQRERDGEGEEIDAFIIRLKWNWFAITSCHEFIDIDQVDAYKLTYNYISPIMMEK